MKDISQALDQYTGICKEVLQDCASKLSKKFESVIIEVLLLYMVITGKINFTQMGRYGRLCEQCYRQNIGRLRSKSPEWLSFNAAFAMYYFGDGGARQSPLTPVTLAKRARRLRISVISGRCRPAPQTRARDNGAGADRHRRPQLHDAACPSISHQATLKSRSTT